MERRTKTGMRFDGGHWRVLRADLTFAKGITRIPKLSSNSARKWGNLARFLGKGGTKAPKREKIDDTTPAFSLL